MINVIVPHQPEKRPLSFYLALEEWVALNLPAADYMFTWIVEPSVIFGRNQVAHLEVDLDYCRSHGISVFRRRSGGGCVYADTNNVMISFITPDTDVASTFARCLGKMAEALRGLGADATVSGRNDLMLGDRKISGNAFYRMTSRSIVHGTLLWDVDTPTMSRAITPSRSKLLSKQVKSVGARVTGLSASLPGLTLAQVVGSLETDMCDSSVTLSDADLSGVAELQRRYHDPAWTFGHRATAPAFQTLRLPTQTVDGAGIFDVTILLAPDGSIADADITGDFFLISDLDPIISRIRGCRPEPEALVAALSGIDVHDIISGLSSASLAAILSGH